MNEPDPAASAAAASAGEHDFGRYGRLLELACKAAAIAGTLVFVGLVVMSIVSITGRKLASAPVPGDVEVLQLCASFAAASFFAWCHLNLGDVKVDFFTERLPARYVHVLDAIGSLLVGAFGVLIAWRTGAGALALQRAGETTMILGLPLWLGQALMVPGFVLLALAGLYRSHWHLRHLRTPVAAAIDAVTRVQT